MKKQFLSVLMAVVMLLTALPLSGMAMPNDYNVTYMYVNTANGGALNLRAGASVDSDVLTQMAYGEQVMLYSYNVGDTWALCTYGAYQGYVMTRYLSSTDPEEAQRKADASAAEDMRSVFKAMKTANYYAVVTPSTPTGYVNLRWAPSKQETVMTKCYAGRVLLVIAQTDNWCQVYDASTGQVGFMMRSFLTYQYDAGNGATIGNGVVVNQ